MRVLVVGATGILRPAAATLAAEGHRVTGVARDATTVPAGVTPCSVDAHDPEALAAALGKQVWDAAVVYEPAITADAWAVIERVVEGPVVWVLTSAAAAPDRADPLNLPGVLLLGWDPSGRWHTPAEVSAAALEVLESGRPRLLGVVRPWAERP